MAILQHIEALSDQLAQSERKVAEVVLQNPQLLEHYTITSLAQYAETSTSAVLRFCHSLGYAGFKEFRYELLSELQRTAQLGESDHDPLRDAAQGIADAIRELVDLDRDALAQLASQIVRARVVYCVGIHRSALPAEKLRMDLEDLGVVAISCGNATHATHLANLIDDESCLVIFSETGSPVSYRPALDAGLAVLEASWVITSNPRAALASHVAHTIVLPSARRAGAGPIDEHPVAMAFVEMLVLLVAEQLRA